MKVLIDANILLDLYQLSGPDLDELKKIIKLCENGQLDIVMPQQIADEFWRNRERVIKESLAALNNTDAKLFLPNISRSHPNAGDIKAAVDSVLSLKKQIVSDTNQAISNRELGADELIAKLFEIAPPTAIDEQVVAKAKLRRDFGNPPGKAGSYGDAINWEFLLACCEFADDVIVVSADSDYESELLPGKLKEFLARELYNITSNQPEFYKGLPAFLKAHFPDIRLSDEIDKLAAISSLESSLSFLATHRAISRLSKFDNFTDSDIERISKAYESNNQIHMIFGDDDVLNFAKKIIALATSAQAIKSIEPLMLMAEQVEPDPLDLNDVPF